MNNYEKIKNMSIDEMAKLIARNSCKSCIHHGTDCDNICKDGIKQWLQEESK